MSFEFMSSLGDAEVLVSCETDGYQATVEGAYIKGEWADASNFAPWKVAEWRRQCERELADDKASIMSGQCDWVTA